MTSSKRGEVIMFVGFKRIISHNIISIQMCFRFAIFPFLN